MKLRARWTAALHRRCLAIAAARPPDFVVGQGPVPYLERWWLLPRNPLLNVYLHRFRRSDDDRALHDHPWPSLSVMTAGRLDEHTFAHSLRERRRRHEDAVAIWGEGTQPTLHYARRRIAAGDVRLRSARFAHRLELLSGEECWTVFITGPVLRVWGFWCEGVRWVDWRTFTDTRDGRSVTGRGCE